MEINALKDWSNVFTANNSKKLLVLLNILSVPYAEWVQTLNNSPIWAKQVKNDKSQRIYLFYTLFKIRSSNIANKVITTSNTPKPYSEYINRPNTYAY